MGSPPERGLADIRLRSPQMYDAVIGAFGQTMGQGGLSRAAGAIAGPGHADSVPPDCLALILAASGHGPVAPPAWAGTPAGARKLIEPLTARELDVLRLLAAGKSNQHIAGDLVITLDTVRST